MGDNRCTFSLIHTIADGVFRRNGGWGGGGHLLNPRGGAKGEEGKWDRECEGGGVLKWE
jgi:hypothetical protein